MAQRGYALLRAAKPTNSARSSAPVAHVTRNQAAASSPVAAGTASSFGHDWSEPSFGHDWSEPSFERDWTELRRASVGGGRALPTAVREMMEPRFGSDFSEVRLHDDQRARALASSIDARAFTQGNDVFFGNEGVRPGSAEGQKLIAHELAHVVQQRAGNQGGAPAVQRYAAGEHAQLGETHEALEASSSEADFVYAVERGETPAAIARRFGVSVEDLKRANAGKVRRWPAASGSGKTVEGFNAGERIAIPMIVNDAIKAALTEKRVVFVVNGVSVQYGVGIAMGDFFERPEDMAKEPKEKLQKLVALIERERGGKPVSTAEWDEATNGRYLKLAERNEKHFAPPNPTLVSQSGKAGANHKLQWEQRHSDALTESQAGAKDEALMINSFADHFLTDAFAAGHVINKRDVMELFKANLTTNAKGEFTAASAAFFDSVAAKAFVGPVKDEFSLHETVEYKGAGVFRPDIDSASRFSALLQGIHKDQPDLVANAIAKAVHDSLNTLPAGLSVTNAKGDKFEGNLSGDGTLNEGTRKIAQKAVAQSQLNVLGVFRVAGPLDRPAMFKKVWDYVPRPTGAGTTQVKEQVQTGTDLKSSRLIDAVANLITTNYKLILKELVKRKILKKA